MKAVKGGVKTGAQVDYQVDRFNFGDIWPRGEVGRILLPVASLQLARRFLNWAGQFSVNKQWQTGLGNGWHGSFELAAIDHRKSVDPGMNQKAFVAEYTGPR